MAPTKRSRSLERIADDAPMEEILDGQRGNSPPTKRKGKKSKPKEKYHEDSDKDVRNKIAARRARHEESDRERDGDRKRWIV